MQPRTSSTLALNVKAHSRLRVIVVTVFKEQHYTKLPVEIELFRRGDELTSIMTTKGNRKRLTK